MKTALRAFSIVMVIVAVVAAVLVFQNDSDDRPPHAELIAAPSATLDHAAEIQAVRDYLAAVAYHQALEEAAKVEAARLAAFRSGSRSGTRCGDDFECFKACTLEIESGGVYEAVSRNGTYRGAWQFDQRTWDSNAAASGRHDLVGVPPDQASVGDQDQIAYDTWQRRGNQPWGGRC